MKQANPGVPQGAEIIYIGRPFGGWAQNPPGVLVSGHYNASVEGVQGPITKQQVNQYAESDGITLFRNEKFGHIAPGQVFSGLTHADINDLPLNGVMTSSGFNADLVLNNGRLIQVDASANTYSSVKYTPVSHTPISSASQNNDIIIFRDYAATPTEWVIWTWEYSGGAEMSIAHASDLSSPTDGFLSGISGATALTALFPHKVWKGPDGNIYVTDGPFVQQITLANGNALTTGNAVWGNRLQVGPGWIVTGGCAYKNYSAIIASSKNGNANRGETRVFLWDGTTTAINGIVSTAPQFIFDIPDNFGNGIFFDGNNLYALTNGRNGTSKVWEFTGRGFGQNPVFESGHISSSNTPIQGSLESYQSGLMIGGAKNSQSHLFRLYQGGFHDEGVITDGTNQATSVGMVKNLYVNQLLLGVKYGSTYAVFNGTNSNYQTNATMRTILFTEGILGRRQYPLGFKGTVNRFLIYLSQWGTGASLTLSLFKDYSTYGAAGSANDLLNLLIDTDTGTPNSLHHYAFPVGTTEMDIADIAIPDISTFYMILTFSHASVSNTAAILRDMVVLWQPSQ